MNKTAIKAIVSSSMPLSVEDGYTARKRTVPGTFHIGVLSGNRLNSGTLRSQFIFFESESDWLNNDASAKNALHTDQRVFVQVQDDVWDVYSGGGNETESTPPILLRHNVPSLLNQIQVARLEVAQLNPMVNPLSCSLQRITYGAPGTGKSHDTDDLIKKYNVANFRTTFHPDSDYATFVGAYKPTMNAGKIEYSFRPQAFMNAYVKAWQLMANPSEDGKTENVVLVIEEINRGNCAQIFGDLFQLLDRDGQSGYSTYPIDADVDLAVWLGGQFGYIEDDENKNGLNVASRPSCLTQSDWNDVLKGKKLALPPNLYIWATMNTSDQSLFPIDSAFKRRWDWKYVPISRPDKSDDPNWKDRKIVANGKLYDWWDFIRIVNAHIADVTKSEDKQLGYFFVKATDDTGVITAERFANKVLFYLFNDVFKDWDLPVAIFEKDSNSKKKFAFKDFFYDVPDANHVVGSVREDVVAAFIEKQEYEGEKVKADAPPSHGGETPDTPDPEFAPPPAQS